MQLPLSAVPASSVLASARVPALPALAEGTDSRLRVFGRTGAFADLRPGSTCRKREGCERVSGRMGSAFGSWVGKVSHESLATLETATIRHLSQNDGIASKAYFGEYVIPADVPAGLRLGFGDVSSFYTAGTLTCSKVSPSCSGAISFMPEAGQDYEVRLSWRRRTCQLSVSQVLADGTEVRLVPVHAIEAQEC